MDQVIDRQLQALVLSLSALSEPDRIAALNRVRTSLHSVSPMRHEPVDCVLWVPSDVVLANDYNPNTVAPPEMRLLEKSIDADGYTQPIVTHADGGQFIVVDGFHRHRVGQESEIGRAHV